MKTSPKMIVFGNVNWGRVDEGVTLVKVSLKALLYKRVSYWLTIDHLNLVRFELTKVPTQMERKNEGFSHV